MDLRSSKQCPHCHRRLIHGGDGTWKHRDARLPYGAPSRCASLVEHFDAGHRAYDLWATAEMSEAQYVAAIERLRRLEDVQWVLRRESAMESLPPVGDGLISDPRPPSTLRARAARLGPAPRSDASTPPAGGEMGRLSAARAFSRTVVMRTGRALGFAVQAAILLVWLGGGALAIVACVESSRPSSERHNVGSQNRHARQSANTPSTPSACVATAADFRALNDACVPRIRSLLCAIHYSPGAACKVAVTLASPEQVGCGDGVQAGADNPGGYIPLAAHRYCAHIYYLKHTRAGRRLYLKILKTELKHDLGNP
jgi:hypothetical protein